MKLRVRQNAVFNLAGGAVPALMALATIPFIVHGLGDAGYGLFTLILAIIGYFALLDVNVTAGSVKYLAKYAAEQDREGVNQTVSFGLIIYLGIGLTGAGAIFFCSDVLIEHVFDVPDDLRLVGKTALEIAAFGFLFGQLQVYLQSIPQALLRYDVTSRIEMGFGMGLPLGTVALLLTGYGLVEIIVFRVIASVANCAFLWLNITRLIPEFMWTLPGKQIVREIAEFSAFSFLTRVASVTYAYADKLIIGAMLGVKELAYYTVAATLANRVLGLMYRVSAVLFPTASVLVAKGKYVQLESLYLKVSRYVVFMNASILVLIFSFSGPILHYWIGETFALRGSLILKLIAVAMFIESLSNIPSLVNDGMGHPRITGSFAFIRAMVGLVALYLFVGAGGITGAAWAHLASAALMVTIFLVYVHGRTVPCTLGNLISRSYRLPILGVVVIGAITTLLVDIAGENISWLIAVMLVSALMLFVFGILLVLLPGDRILLNARLSGLIARRS